MARVKTRMPMPPTHWRKDRQNKIPLGSTSTSLITVAPVVVRPETASKKASAVLVRLPENIKGRAAKREVKNQPKVTIRIASRFFKREDVPPRLTNTTPTKAAMPMDGASPQIPACS